jgi:hypothetical protein
MVLFLSIADAHATAADVDEAAHMEASTDSSLSDTEPTRPAAHTLVPVTPSGSDPRTASRPLYEQEMANMEAERRRREETARRSGKKLLLGGGITLGAGYLFWVAMGAALLRDGISEAGYLFIPIAGGPVFTGKSYNKSHDDVGAAVLSVFTVIPAIAQVTGLGILIAGLIRRIRYKKAGQTGVALVPTLGHGGVDLRFIKTF